MDLGLTGKWALVCAASKGLGKGCAQALVNEGVNVVITARGEEALQATSTELRALQRGEVRTVAVAVRGRRRGDVLGDVVAGILLANGVARSEWAALIDDARASVDVGPVGPRFLDAA